MKYCDSVQYLCDTCDIIFRDPDFDESLEELSNVNPGNIIDSTANFICCFYNVCYLTIFKSQMKLKIQEFPDNNSYCHIKAQTTILDL